MQAVQTRIEHPTFETVWAALQETAERQKETDRMIKENAREAAEWQKKEAEWRKEANERFGELGKRFGFFENRFGEMIEHLVVPGLIQRFKELGYEFDKAYRDTDVKDEKNNTSYQVDITLENGDKVMIIEVKNKPNIGDITDHIERMEKVRARADRHGDKRKFLGAVAGIVFNANEKTFALKNGFFVLEPAGDIFAVIPPEGIYSPREW